MVNTDKRDEFREKFLSPNCHFCNNLVVNKLIFY